MPPRKLANLSILDTTTESAVLDFLAKPNQYIRTLLISSPATLSQIVTVHAATPGGSFRAYQEGGSDVTLTAAKCRTLDVEGLGKIKLVSTGAVTADHAFELSGFAPGPN